MKDKLDDKTNGGMNEQVSRQLSEIGIVPVIKLSCAKDAKALASALIAGGVPAAEVTFRAKGADQVIKDMLAAYPDMMVGAGTVINMEQAKRAVEAGAKFIVSPGFDPEITAYVLSQHVLPCPGCVTPSEIQQALKSGLKMVKFFPAEQYGGLATIKALAGPFGDLKFMPTGGISLKNLGEYLSDKSVAACGGSYMVTAELLDNRKWDEVTKLCRQSAELVETARKKIKTQI